MLFRMNQRGEFAEDNNEENELVDIFSEMYNMEGKKAEVSSNGSVDRNAEI